MKVDENLYFHGNYHHASVTEARMISTVYKTTIWYHRFFPHKDRSSLQGAFSVLVIS